MLLNLKGKMQSIHKEMERIRAGTAMGLKGPLAGKPDVTLSEYLAATYAAGCTNKDGSFDMGHLYYELEINPSIMTVEQLIDLDQDSRWLVPEIFRDAIRKGLRTAPFFNKLIVGNESVAQPQVNMPYLNLSDAEPADTAEAETISTGSVSYGYKTVSIGKQAIGIKISDEAVRYTKLSLLTIFLQDMGIKLGQKLNNSFINTMINGDLADLSEAAATIGVSNTTIGMTYEDVLRAWIRASRLGRQYGVIIAGEAMANRILNLTEFKDKQAGTPQQNIVVNEQLPSQSQLYVSAQVPDDQAILMDPKFSAVQLTSAPLAVEAERIVSKQISGSYASITTGFAVVFRDARVIIDQSLDIATNDFPSFMTPTL